MEHQNHIYTQEDRNLIRSCNALAQGITAGLGPGYYVSLCNPEVTADPSDPVSAALDALREGQNRTFCCFSKNDHGSPVRSTFVPLTGVGGQLIAMIRIDFDLSTPLQQLLAGLSDSVQLLPSGSSFEGNTEQQICQSVRNAREEVARDIRITPSNRNREIISRLWKANVFSVRDSVALVARELDISINTVYLHLRTLRRQN